MRALFFFLLISAGAFGQQNFTTENNEVVWQKIYESELSKDDIKEIIEKDPVLTSVAENFIGVSVPVKLDCEQTQPIFMRDQIQYFTSIDFKEGRYRVTVSKIELLPSTTASLYGVETTNNPVPYNDYQVKKNGELRTGKMLQNSRECLNKYLQEKFNFKKSSDDW
ncbi:MAG: hypothetical protein ACQEWG_09225 [Bacteroidota bacterium]